MCAFARLRAWQSLVEANTVSVVRTPGLIFLFDVPTHVKMGRYKVSAALNAVSHY